MDSLNSYIGRAIDAGDLAQAQARIDDFVAESGETATTLYWRGNIALKQNQWDKAIGFYSQSEALDAHGPGREARLMLDDIMCFYNKDLYNP